MRTTHLTSEQIISLPTMGGSVDTVCVGVGPGVVAAPCNKGEGVLHCPEEATCRHNFISPVIKALLGRTDELTGHRNNHCIYTSL